MPALAASPATTLPDPQPARRYKLPVPGGHVLQVREWGDEQGRPALLLHGGPGSGCSPVLARPFDLGQWRVIAPDQRGAGESRPAGATHANTLRDLLDDLRLLRAHLGLADWFVTGGSWGATLALAHALDAPEAVTGLLLRSVFLARASDVDGFFEPPGAAALPAWQALAQAAAAMPGGTLLQRLHAVLHGPDEAAALAAALAWRNWELQRAGVAPLEGAGGLAGPGTAGGTQAGGGGSSGDVADPDDAARSLLQRYRVQSHYLVHRCWLDAPPLLDRVQALPAVPTLLLHGTDDRICLPQGAQAFIDRMPPGAQATLQWIPGAGHDPTHPGMAAATAAALRRAARTGRFTP